MVSGHAVFMNNTDSAGNKMSKKKREGRKKDLLVSLQSLQSERCLASKGIVNSCKSFTNKIA